MRAMLPAFVVLLLTLTPAAAQEPSLTEAEARLAAINALARGHYTRARDAVLAEGPVIVVEAEAVTLLNTGSSERVLYLPARYRHFKALGHVAMGLWSLLDLHLEKPVDPGLRSALTAYRNELAGLQPHIAALGLRWDDSNRQREILATSIAFIDAVLASGRVRTDERRAWADEIAPALLGNAYDAAELQITALHTLVERWRTGLAPDQWESLRVVVLGPNRPREAHPPYAYFVRRLGAEAIGRRLVNADNIDAASGGLDLLATTLTDARVAADFFGDSGRLQRGLLSDATTVLLDRLLGR
jgi:hypothetical protein